MVATIKAIGTAVLSFAGSAVASTISTVINIAIGIAIIVAILNIFPVDKIFIADSMYNFLVGGNFKKLMNLIYYFFPVDFALSCLGTVMLVNIGVIFHRVINYVLNYTDKALNFSAHKSK